MTLQNTLISPDFSVNKTSICITIEKWSMYGDEHYTAIQPSLMWMTV